MQGHVYYHRSVDVSQTSSGQRLQMKRADIVPDFGPRNRPLIIDRIVLMCESTLTVAVTAVDGEDVWRSIRNLTLMQRDKVPRINQVNGDQLRLAMVEKSGVEHIKEHIDLPVAGATQYTFEFPIELASRKSYDEDDLAMPGELLDYLEWTGITTGTEGPCVAGGTLTIGTTRWWTVAECREVDYNVVNPTDTIEVANFTGMALSKLVDGRVHGLIVHRRGATGGATLASITDVAVDELGKVSLSQADLVAAYARSRGQVTGSNAASPGVQLRNDPFIAAKALALVWTGPKVKVRSGPVLNSLTVRANPSGAYTDLTAITRIIKPRYDANMRLLERIHGKGEGWRPKTRDKTRQDFAAWGADGAWIPAKQNLPRYY